QPGAHSRIGVDAPRVRAQRTDVLGQREGGEFDAVVPQFGNLMAGFGPVPALEGFVTDSVVPHTASIPSREHDLLLGFGKVRSVRRSYGTSRLACPSYARKHNNALYRAPAWDWQHPDGR